MIDAEALRMVLMMLTGWTGGSGRSSRT